MKKVRVEVIADVKGQKNVDNLNDSLQETQQETENVNEGFQEMGGAADAALGGAVGKFQSFKNGIMSSVKSLGIMKVAIAATGLGLLLILIGSIKAAFTSTEEGQNKFAKLMNAIGVVTGNLIDLLADLGNTIISAFENPKQALKDFWEALKQNVVVRINSVIDMFGLLGKAISQVFEGDFSGAMESAKQAGLKYVDAMTGVEDSVNKATKAVSGFIDETIREIGVMNELSDTQARVDKMIRTQLVERARLEGIVSDSRLKSLDSENYSTLQRLEFLKQAMEANDQIFAQEQAIAEERLRIRREQNKLAGSTKEDLMEEAQLEADLIRLVKQRADANREIFTQQIALRRLYMEENRGLSEEELADLEESIQDDIDAIEEGEDAKVEMWQNTAKAKVKIDAQTAAATLGAFASLFGSLAAMSADNFEQQKKFKIAEAVASTLQGGIQAFMGGVSTIPGPFGVVLGALLAGVTLAAGYVNVRKIQQTKPGAGAGGGGGGFSAGATPRLPSTAAPSFSSITPATSGEQRITDSIDRQGADVEPSRAYVVSENVETGASLDRNIKANASI